MERVSRINDHQLIILQFAAGAPLICNICGTDVLMGLLKKSNQYDYVLPAHRYRLKYSPILVARICLKDLTSTQTRNFEDDLCEELDDYQSNFLCSKKCNRFKNSASNLISDMYKFITCLIVTNVIYLNKL